MFLSVDPDTFGGLPEPPDQVKHAFSYVFASREIENNTRKLKVRLHPILGRWCVWELGRTNDNKEHIWHCIWICGSLECPHPDYVASDYADKPLLQHFAGLIGEYRLPTRADFETLDRFDRQKYGADAVENFQISQENAITNAKNSEFEAFTHDFIHHHDHMIIDEANQRAGSMQRSWMTVEDVRERFRSNPAFYVIERVPLGDGKFYKSRRKRTHEEWLRFEKWMARELRNAYARKDPNVVAQVNEEVGMDKSAFRKKLGLEAKASDTARLPAGCKIPQAMLAAMHDEWFKARVERGEQLAERTQQNKALRESALQLVAVEVRRGGS